MQVIRCKQLARHLGVSRATIYRFIADPALSFPQQFPLGPNSVGWDFAEIENWIAARKASTRLDKRAGDKS
jgi:predicted DNA-binding transcriptional regulator AlpA